MIYSKAATTIEEQIVKLQKRGLIIADESVAKHFLLNVGYYRLAGYWWPMQSDKVDPVRTPSLHPAPCTLHRLPNSAL